MAFSRSCGANVPQGYAREVVEPPSLIRSVEGVGGSDEDRVLTIAAFEAARADIQCRGLVFTGDWFDFLSANAA